MNKKGILIALLSVSTLLLTPGSFAQQEVIDPQPEPEGESSALSSTPAAPEAVPQHTEQASQKPEVPAPQAIPLATSKPAQRDTLLSTSTIVGTTVKNAQGEELGKIQELMIDAEGGRIAHVVVVFGGILGMNQKWVEIPWEALKVGLGTQELVVELDEAALQQSHVGNGI
jgi:sporulation protein YlmC with PRC-barrel domain